jgi:dephospho-CoA kinase
VILRNNLQQEDIEKIIATQAPRALRLQYADYVLNNNGTLDELQEQVNAIHTKIVRDSDLSRGL